MKNGRGGLLGESGFQLPSDVVLIHNFTRTGPA